MKFCYWHTETKENPEGTDCAVDLDRAEIFVCPYSVKDIEFGERFPGSGKNSFYIKKCPDFRLIKELKGKLSSAKDEFKVEALNNLLGA